MTANTRKTSRRRKIESQSKFKQVLVQFLPIWILVAAALALVLPDLLIWGIHSSVDAIGAIPGIAVDVGEDGLHTAANVVGDVVKAGADVVVTVAETGAGAISDTAHWVMDQVKGDSSAGDLLIAPLFTDEVLHWQEDIVRWSETYDLDPNLFATVMQIESCGHPTVNSSAGAQGLFQVMPMNFQPGDDYLDPDTNALRGGYVLKTCLDLANGDTGLAMACYNGGPSVLRKDFNTWLAEPQRYFMWGTGIYTDARATQDRSATLERWLDAGGQILCDMASAELGLN